MALWQLWEDTLQLRLMTANCSWTLNSQTRACEDGTKNVKACSYSTTASHQMMLCTEVTHEFQYHGNKLLEKGLQRQKRSLRWTRVHLHLLFYWDLIMWERQFLVKESIFLFKREEKTEWNGQKINLTAVSLIHISQPTIDFNDKAVFNYCYLIWSVDNGHTMVKQSIMLSENEFQTMISQLIWAFCRCIPISVCVSH